ncbi:MAG: antitoxin [Candidatus Staskawiczbacteria bacterium]|nr:antitoxin [Candidatus Staskawiczbacteria bacterium]
MNKKIKLTKEEKDIVTQVERGDFVSSKIPKNEINYYSLVARSTTAKNKTIPIRISELDLLRLKALALREGVPYQTLISASLKKLVA